MVLIDLSKAFDSISHEILFFSSNYVIWARQISFLNDSKATLLIASSPLDLALDDLKS